MKDYDIHYEDQMSDCCGAEVYADIMICSNCKEHCDLHEEDC